MIAALAPDEAGYGAGEMALQRVSSLVAGGDVERDRPRPANHHWRLCSYRLHDHRHRCFRMRDIKPFFVADALADFSREEHLMALKYVAGRSGRVVMTEELLPLPASKAALRALILPLLDESDEPLDDENLIDYGLDSVRMMAPGRPLAQSARRYRLRDAGEEPDHRRLVGAALP